MNTFNFTEVFNGSFGQIGKGYAYPDKASSRFAIRFTTPKAVVSYFKFEAGGSALGQVFDGTVILSLFDSAGNMLYSAEDVIDGFVNNVDEWPSAGERGLSFSPGGGENEKSRPDTLQWLKPGLKYVLKVECVEGWSEGNPIQIAFSNHGLGGPLEAAEPPEPVDYEGTDSAGNLAGAVIEINGARYRLEPM